jgi:Fic family protein
MVLYDQPFAVANGRLARALFYWNMLRNGYELVTLLSISQVLLSACAQYERSFRYVVTDENDATYFVIYHLDILIKALGLFEKSQESGNR